LYFVAVVGDVVESLPWWRFWAVQSCVCKRSESIDWTSGVYI